MHLLDTNICIYLIKEHPPEVLKRLQRHRPEDVAISSITLGELRYGVEKSQQRERNAQALELFLAPLQVLPFDADASSTYGTLRAQLEKLGTPIGVFDSMIAAHALSRDATLVTNNQREFARIKGLKLDNWVR